MLIVKWEELKAAMEELNETDLTAQLKVKPTDTIVTTFLKAVESIPSDREEEIPDSVANFYNQLITEIEDKGKKVILDILNKEEEKPAKKKGKVKKKVEPEPEVDPFAEDETEEESSSEETEEETETEPEEDFAEETKKEIKTKEKEKKAQEKPEKKPLPQRKKVEEKVEVKPRKEPKPRNAEKDQFGSVKTAGTHRINNMFVEGKYTVEQIAEEVSTTKLRVKNHIAHIKSKGYEFEMIKTKKGDVLIKVILEK